MKHKNIIEMITWSDFWMENEEFIIIWFIGFVITMIVGWIIVYRCERQAKENNEKTYPYRTFIWSVTLWSVLWPILWTIGIACGWTGFLGSLRKK